MLFGMLLLKESGIPWNSANRFHRQIWMSNPASSNPKAMAYREAEPLAVCNNSKSILPLKSSQASSPTATQSLIARKMIRFGRKAEV